MISGTEGREGRGGGREEGVGEGCGGVYSIATIGRLALVSSAKFRDKFGLLACEIAINTKTLYQYHSTAIKMAIPEESKCYKNGNTRREQTQRTERCGTTHCCQANPDSRQTRSVTICLLIVQPRQRSTNKLGESHWIPTVFLLVLIKIHVNS